MFLRSLLLGDGECEVYSFIIVVIEVVVCVCKFVLCLWCIDDINGWMNGFSFGGNASKSIAVFAAAVSMVLWSFVLVFCKCCVDVWREFCVVFMVVILDCDGKSWLWLVSFVRVRWRNGGCSRIYIFFWVMLVLRKFVSFVFM